MRRGFQWNLETIKGNYGEQMVYSRLKKPEFYYTVRLDPEPVASNYDLLFQEGKTKPLQLEVKVCEYFKKPPLEKYTGINLQNKEDYNLIEEPILLIFIDKSNKLIYGNYYKYLKEFGIETKPTPTGIKVVYPLNKMKEINKFIEGFDCKISDKELEDIEMIDSYNERDIIYTWEQDELIDEIFTPLFKMRYKK